MGYRGKTAEREQARRLRAEAWTLQEIADRLGVSKGSVSVWVRDVDFTPRPRRPARRRAPNALQRRKAADIAAGLEWGRQQLGELTDRDLLVAGAALYAGEGAKTDGAVGFANTNPAMVQLFCTWLRRFFVIDESRLRARLYLHAGLDLDEATAFWSEVTHVPPQQFIKPYRAAADNTRRQSKHAMGCLTLTYSCSATHRKVMGLVRALLGGGRVGSEGGT